MLMTVSELRKYLTTDLSDEVLKSKLDAIEYMIRGYTNNNFHTQIQSYADITDGKITADYIPFLEGDTVHVEGTPASDGIYTVGFNDVLNEPIRDCENALLTHVLYPSDIKMGAVNLMQWELENRDKVGIASESISRHSVSYFNMDGDNSMLGYPKSLIGFMKPYRKARF